MQSMKLPRWTVYPALALIAALVVTAVPHAAHVPPNAGAAQRARAAFLQRKALSSKRVEISAESPQPHEPAPARD